jgi:autotransporter-associated beta strand protein
VINAGTLQLGNGTSGNDGSLTGSSLISNGGTLIFDNFAAQTYAGSINGSGPVIVNAVGVLSLSGVNGDTGPLIINSGTVSIGAAGVNNETSAEMFSTINVSSGATLVFAGVNTFGYFGSSFYKPAIFIDGGTVTNTNTDNYIGGQITMTGGTINGQDDFRLQPYTSVSNFALVTTNPTTTTATISVPSLSLVSGSADFNVSSGSVPSKVDLLISSVVSSSGLQGIIKDGSGTLMLTASNSYTGGTTINAGLLVASQGLASLGVPNQNPTDSNGNPQPIYPTAYINGGNLILRNTSAGTVFSMLQTGFNGGAWNTTTGITSTAAASDATHLHAVGMLQPSATTTFEGQTLFSTDVALKYTYFGDANLDGKVDGTDYSIIDNSYEMEKTAGNITGWQNGDFNYDGVVDGSDYTLIDNAFNSQGTQISAEIASPTAQIAGGYAAVPEPATLGLLGIGAIGLLGRRRRQH